jgi:cytochrome c oxidase assembly protein subunit 15
VLAAVCTLALIGVGGLVTSHGVGMAVPDWPTSYGYNMFYFPIRLWEGGVFFEHTHRLFAALVGLLTSILAAWLWARETQGRARWAGFAVILILVAALGHRGSGNTSGGAAGIPIHFKILAGVLPVLLIFAVVQSVRTRGALRWLGMTAFFAVIFQGILGGMRVALYQDQFGIFHATLAQLFLVLLAALALLTSRRWQEMRLNSGEAPISCRVRAALGVATLLVFGQLVLGASMRHQHAGLAVPDFPLAYGRLWPVTDAATLTAINQSRADVRGYNAITTAQIHLHMAHRLGALLALAAVVFAVALARREVRAARWPRGLAAAWLALMLCQALLGAWTVWSNKAADIATLHVMLGALNLVVGALLFLCAGKLCGAGEELPTSRGESRS